MKKNNKKNNSSEKTESIVRQLESKHMKWLDIVNPTTEQLETLRQEYRFHPLDIEDCLSPIQHPKLDVHPYYLFMVLRFPEYEPTTREIRANEVNFLIFANVVITIRRYQHTSVDELFTLCSDDPIKKEELLHTNPSTLIYELLERLFLAVFPMLRHVTRDLVTIEKQIFSGQEKSMVQEIMIARRNITDFRVILQSHRSILQKLLRKSEQLFSTARLQLYFQNLIEHSDDIQDILDNQKEHVETLQETNESLISFRLNDIIKLLTVISVSAIPVNIIMSFVTMNTPMPFISESPYSFWIVCLILILVSFTTLGIFRYKKWL